MDDLNRGLMYYECGLCHRRWEDKATWEPHVAAMVARAERDRPVREWLERQLLAMRVAWRRETCDAPHPRSLVQPKDWEPCEED